MSVGSAHHRHCVVIVGCGFGGLFAARALRRADVDVTVVDRNNHHLFQPLLDQMATEIPAEGEIAPPIRDKVTAPLIAECYANFGCRLRDTRMIRTYGLFVWEVVKAHVALSPKPNANDPLPR